MNHQVIEGKAIKGYSSHYSRELYFCKRAATRI